VLPKPPPSGFYQPYLDGVQGLWAEWEKIQEKERRKGKGKGKAVVEVEEDDEEDEVQVEEGKKQVELPDLAGIPAYFFDSGFDLANPLTWERVMASSTPSSSTSPSILPSSDIHGFLSSHLDDLETHLVHEISLRTPSFFSALSNLQSLNAQTSSCLSRISALRNELADLDERQAIKGLRIINTHEKLRRSKVVRRAVGEVDGVRSAGRLARELGEAGDWVGALEGMEAVGRWWKRYSGEQEDEQSNGNLQSASTTDGKTTGGPVLTLATLESLKSIPSDLSILSQQITTQLEAALSSLVMSVIGASSNSVAPSRATSPALQSSDTATVEARHQQSRMEFRHQSQSLLIGLARCNARDSALRVWKTCVSKVVKEGMRQHLQIDHEGEDDHEETKG
jgi:vacuolar protein sorting-associated protein 54